MTSVADKLARKSERRTATKQVCLRLVKVDVWSVVKIAAILALCIAVVMVVAAILLWFVLQQTGVMQSVDNLLNDVTGSKGVTVETFVSFPGVLIFSVITAVLQFIVTTALSAIGAAVYNLIAKITGGLVFGFTNQ